MNTEEIERFVEALLTRLCAGVIAHPEDFAMLKTYSGSSLSKYNVQSNAADCPRLMGRGGERFRAFRFIGRAAGAKMGHQIILETLVKPTKGTPEPFPKFKFDAHWPKTETMRLLDDTCDAVFHHPVKTELVEAVGSAIMVVTIDPREPLVLVEEASKSLTNLFGGIGVTNGCQISVDVVIGK